MKRPYVICHMLASLDGKISGAFMDAPQAAEPLKVYGELRGFFDCRATLYGTTTMLGGYADGEIQLRGQATELSQDDYITEMARSADQLIIALDPEGKLAYRSAIITKKGRAPAIVCEVLTERASYAYLGYLRERGISYIFAGKEEINVPLLLEKLETALGIERLLLAGGGVTNGYFLHAGCIDELSLVLAPLVSGQTQAAALFDLQTHAANTAFALKEIQQLESGGLWLRYFYEQQ